MCWGYYDCCKNYNDERRCSIPARCSTAVEATAGICSTARKQTGEWGGCGRSRNGQIWQGTDKIQAVSTMMCASCTIGGGEPNAGRKEAERLWLLHTTAEERKNPTAEVYENYYDKVNNADVAEDMAKLDELYKKTEVEHAEKVRNRLEATPSKIPRLAKKKAGETKVPAPLKKAEQTRVQAPLKRAVKKVAGQKEANVVASAKAATPPTVTDKKGGVKPAKKAKKLAPLKF
jgi:hypothetical protein